jgi:polyisoprenoid-binding protein YceI
MPALDGCYEIDAANSSIGFAARYAMVTTVRGTFGAFHADISFDGEVPDRSIVSVRVEAASLSTGQAQRDEHLRSPDFLDVATYPEITFESAGVQVHDGNHYRLSGELTICAATRPFDIDFVLTG